MARSTLQTRGPSRTANRTQHNKATRAPRPQPGKAQPESEHTQVLRDCIDACNRCLAYCLEQGGEHADADHIKLMMDCMEVCITTADLVGRDSEFADAMMQVCADVCAACAESCGDQRFEGHEVMEACAQACRDCADHCSS